MKSIILFCVGVAFISAINANFTEEDLIADAGPLGKIRGVNTSSVGETTRPFVSFLGMRYAEAPILEKRFLPSVRYSGPLNETGDIFEANSPGFICIQPTADLNPVNQNEDCLTVNVYTPKPNPTGGDTGLLPVIFFIHGGAFLVGSGHQYSGFRLMNRDVVLVSFNYRLGLLGFWSLARESVPGNAGLYDILNALKWTKDFIKYFGGDPNKITIAGQSAGSAAVTHLLASPLVGNDLLQGAIASSGSALAEWATTLDPTKANEVLPGHLMVAISSNCYTYTGVYPDDAALEQIAVCMRSAQTTTTRLILAQGIYQIMEQRQGRLGFDASSPSVQAFNTVSPAFEKILPEPPRDVFAQGKQVNVSLMMGSTRHDGSYVLGVYYNQFLRANEYVNDTEYMSRKAVADILSALGIPDSFGVYDSIAKMYLGDTRTSGNFWEMYPGLMDICSVFFFKASTYQTALYHTELNSNTYFYSFDYKGRQTVWNILFAMPENIPPFPGGITHGDDLLYLFNVTPQNQPGFNAEENAVSERMLDYWANFAATGNPTPAGGNLDVWNPLTFPESKFMSIGAESIEGAQYDDDWSGVGWEVVPQEPTTTEATSEPPSSEPPSSEPPSSEPTTKESSSTTEGASGAITSYKYLIMFASGTLTYLTVTSP